MWDLLRKLFHSSESPFERANEDDIYYGFRLFLRREPRPEELAFWRRMLTEHHITLQMLATHFVNDAEFLALLEEDRRPRPVELEDFTIFVRPNDFFSGAAIAAHGIYEPHVTEAIRRTLEPGMIFLDIGANIGYYTLLGAALVGRQGHVHAFEPNPENCRLLRKSLISNGFTNVTLHQHAVAEQPQTFILDTWAVDSNARVIDYEPGRTDRRGEHVLVDAVLVDEVLTELPRLDVIKIDIEGSEPRALQGMTRLIRQHRPRIFSEFNPEMIALYGHSTGRGYLEQLYGLGYEITVLGREGHAQKHYRLEEILKLLQESRLTHLDLLAAPRGEAL